MVDHMFAKLEKSHMRILQSGGVKGDIKRRQCVKKAVQLGHVRGRVEQASVLVKFPECNQVLRTDRR